MNEKKAVIIRMEPELHKKIKMAAVMKGTTVQDFLTDIIITDLDKKKEKK